MLWAFATAVAAPIGQVAVGIWPLEAAPWGYHDAGLRTHAWPEPSVLAALALPARGRTHGWFGVQGDAYHRSWDFEGAQWAAITAVRAEGTFGAHTDLGPPTRDRTDLWLEYGGGFAVVPAWAPTHPMVTRATPTLHLHLGVARGLGSVRPFGLVEGRIGEESGGVGECPSSPCPSLVNAPAGPGVALMVGLTH